MAAPVTVKDIAKEMICPCPDCGKQALDQCPSCAVGEKLRGEIATMLQEGKTKDQVMTQFAATYGDDILGDPPARGFAKYAAWMPFIAAACGLLPIACILILSGRRRKARRTTAAAAIAKTTPTPAASPATDDPLLRQALRDFDY
jgi:cytochrome c-type biogenesis protein CcmH